MISLIAALASVISSIWYFALFVGFVGKFICTLFPGRVSRVLDGVWRFWAAVHQELWLFAAPGILVVAVDHWHGPAKWSVVFDALELFYWWFFRNWPDENRWKRRGRKAAAAVAKRAGRLVVVPVPEQS